MIASLSGILLSSGPESLVVEVSGIGYEVFVPATHLSRFHAGESATLLTRMVVREDSISLYGFVSDSERAMFDALCSISGVGPKLALAVLSRLGAEGLAAALNSQDESALRAVSGVGQKTARLILVSLADRVSPVSGGRRNLVTALVNLGITEFEAQSLVAKVDPALDDAMALRAALKLRGGRD